MIKITGDTMHTRMIAILFLAVALLACPRSSRAEENWQDPVTATFSGTNYEFTNSTAAMLSVRDVLFRSVVASSNTISLYVVDGSTEFRVYTSAITTNYCYAKPDGDGKIWLKNTKILRLTQTLTNSASLIINTVKE